MTVKIIRYNTECEVKYRFTCHTCGFLTQWFTHVLNKSVSVRPAQGLFGTAVDDSLVKAQAAKQLARLVIDLQCMLDAQLAGQEAECTPFVREQFHKLFAHAKYCPHCKRKQPWGDVVHTQVTLPPDVLWGEIVDLPPQEVLQQDLSISLDGRMYGVRTLRKTGIEKESLACWPLREVDHKNLQDIFEVIEKGPGIFTVLEETLPGRTLFAHITDGVTEEEFCNIALQLCDALECLHQQQPRLTHNAVAYKNIQIAPDGRLVLTAYDRLTTGTPPRRDIIMLGKLLAASPFTKRYRKVTEGCMTGVYKAIGPIREDIIIASKKTHTRLLVLLAVLVAVACFALAAQFILNWY